MTYTVIYRTGGTDRFEWREALPVSTMQEAISQKDSLERAGYRALIHRTSALTAIGMPETYDGGKATKHACGPACHGPVVAL